ncbi:MAG: radical SAM protein [Candidatus Eisenbacteria bacterium]
MKTGLAIKVALRSAANLLAKKPLCVSFEVTYSCPATCRHCNRGGLKKEDGLMSPEDYRRLSHELSISTCQLSGGEPLTREDLEDIVRAVKRPSGLPMLICVSNWWLMTEERYVSLNEAGVDIFSVSLDFPDKRHDDFRQIKGHYDKLNDLIPRMARKYGKNNIVLNAALTHANFSEIPGLVEQAETWGVKIAFSAYCVLRTGDSGYCITDKRDLELLREHIAYLVEHKKHSDTVLSSSHLLKNTLRFFEDGGNFPGCKAGERFLIIRPDGVMNACSFFPEHEYKTQKEARERFDIRNTCTECYVAIRSSTERSLVRLFRDSVEGYKQIH